MSLVSIPTLEYKVDGIIKIIFDIYNYIANIDLTSIRNKDLFHLRTILDSLRSTHCTLLHNERKTDLTENRIHVCNEHYHSAFANIRSHIADLQDYKQDFNYSYLTEKITDLRETTQQFIQLVLELNLRQNYYVRIQFYKYHLKALSTHCTFYHIHTPIIHNWRRSLRSELQYAELHKRSHDLIWSFQDKRHELQTEKEPFPHPDFMRY